MFQGTKHTPAEMIATLRRAGATASEEDRGVLLDTARMIAELVVSASVVRNKAQKLYNERETLSAVADKIQLAPEGEVAKADAV